MKLGGMLMLIMGVFLYFNWITKLISFLTNRFFGGFTGFLNVRKMLAKGTPLGYF